MKKLLLTLIAALSISQAQAYTAEEIAQSGKRVLIAINQGRYSIDTNVDTKDLPGYIYNDTEVTCENGYLCLKDLVFPEVANDLGYSNPITLQFTVSGTTATMRTMSKDQTFTFGSGYSTYYDDYYNKYYNVYDAYTIKSTLIDQIDSNSYLMAFSASETLSNGESNLNVNDQAITGTISKDADGNFYIDLGEFLFAKAVMTTDRVNYLLNGSGCNNYGTPWYGNILFLNEVDYYGGLHAHKFDVNTKISHTATNNTDNSVNTYDFDANVLINGNNIRIWNFADLGYSVVSQLNQNTFKTSYTPYEGTLDFQNLTATIKNGEYGIGDFDLTTTEIYFYNTNICGPLDENGTDANSINGQIIGTLTHETQHNNWLNTGRNDITVLKDPYIWIDEYYMYDICADLDTKNKIYTFSNTMIPLVGVDEIEYTHDCKINVTASGYGLVGSDASKGNHIYIYGNVESLQNDLFVNPDGYELYIMPAEAGEPDFTHSNFSDENGHINGTKIDLADYYYHWAPEATQAGVAYANEDPTAKAEALNQGANFCLMVPESDLKVKSDDGKYAVYCAAKYVDGTNLADSFHAYTVLNPGMTGIMDVDSDDIAASITAGEGYITICGSDGNAAVTTASGTVLYQGGDGTVDVAPGMYIVRAGKTVKKVLVK